MRINKPFAFFIGVVSLMLLVHYHSAMLVLCVLFYGLILMGGLAHLFTRDE